MVINTFSEHFLVVSDDLYPMLGEGNKGRKMDAIVSVLEEKSTMQ